MLLEFILREAGQCDVYIREVLQFTQEPGQELLVPGAGYFVEGQVQQMSLLLG